MPRGLQVFGWLVFPGAALLACRILWEETLLTWKNGPQMIGFSVLHTHGHLFLLGVACLGMLLLWLPVAVVTLASSRVRGRRPTPSEATQTALAAAVFGLLLVPYGFWQWVGVRTLGPGTHGSSFLVDAAARGDGRLVNALLSRGISVDEPEPAGPTALSAAASAGRADMVRLLLRRGARVNQQSGVWSWTPLMTAAASGEMSVVRDLLAADADLNPRDTQGRTAEAIAAAAGHRDVAALLHTVWSQKIVARFEGSIVHVGVPDQQLRAIAVGNAPHFRLSVQVKRLLAGRMPEQGQPAHFLVDDPARLFIDNLGVDAAGGYPEGELLFTITNCGTVKRPAYDLRLEHLERQNDGLP